MHGASGWRLVIVGAIAGIAAMMPACSRPPGSAVKEQASIAPASDGSAGPISDRAVSPTAGQLGPARFDSARAWKDLEAQVGFGPRPSGSPALQNTRDYILAELKKAGVAATQQMFIAKTPLGDTPMANVIATIPGRRPERIAIASHFDT
ncbi:MAG TPA: hypothetical protein VFV95_15025, partial [Vicinamibacterales bacterium]|nr:hypothetical protein [Vicinamibacterales bacterium]